MENHIRIQILLHEIITEIVQKYLEFKIQPESFEVFLKNHQHVLYHLCFNKGRCCSCTSGHQSPLQQILRKPQFEELFKQQGRACGQARNCCCMYNPTQNITTTDIDITLCTTIIFNCCNGCLQHQQEIALREIRDARNLFSHSKNNNLSATEFRTQWNRITNAGKLLAKFTSGQYWKEVEERIERLERRPVAATDYTESYRRLAEEKYEMNENLQNVGDRLNNIESHLEREDNIESNVCNVQTVFNNFNFFLVPTKSFSTDAASTKVQLDLTHQSSFDVPDENFHSQEFAYYGNENKFTSSEMMNMVTYPNSTCEKKIYERDIFPADRLETLQTNVQERETQISDEDSSGTLIPMYESVVELLDDYDKDADESLLHETACKVCVAETPLQQSDTKYFQIYNEIETLKTQGRDNFCSAINYSLLVYIMIRGSSTINSINIDILQRIFRLIHSVDVDLQHINLRYRLDDMATDYLDRIGKTFTIRDTTMASALQNSFGYAFPDSFVENCNSDILLKHIRPDTLEYEHSNLVVRVDPTILIDSLIQKLQDGVDAVCVGEYFDVMNEHQIAKEFCEKLLNCNTEISVNSMVQFLDGLTCNGQYFTLFDSIKELYSVLCRHVDTTGNTIIHHMVATVKENERFLLYIEFFCENKFDVMQLENNYKQSPLDIAAYLGRYEVVSSVLDRCSKSEWKDVTSEIFTMLQKGVDVYKSVSSGSSVEIDINIGLETVSFGDVDDFKKILEAIGKEDKIKEIECKFEDDITTKIGKGVVGIVKDVKKGFKCIHENSGFSKIREQRNSIK